MQLIEGKCVFFWFKIVKIAYEISEGVTQLGIGLANTIHQVRRYCDVFLEIYGCHPHTDNFRTQVAGDFDRVNTIAERLGRSAALRIERPSVGGYSFIRRLPTRADCAQQGRVEPAAILVAAFQIEVGRPGQARLVSQDGSLT